MFQEYISYEPYILNDKNISNYLKYKLETNSFFNDIKNPKNNNEVKKLSIKKSENSLFIPKEKDTLFWCYYIISLGEMNYELLNRTNLLLTKQLKIQYVDKIRKNKSILKTYKFDTLTNIESNLANDNYINIKTILSLCLIDKINIIFISKKYYFELIINDSSPIYLIEQLNNDSIYSSKYGYKIADINLLNKIRSSYFKIDSLNKPIKALSFYKISDLIEICDKLAIEIKNKDTGKNKNKNDLYESILQYF